MRRYLFIVVACVISIVCTGVITKVVFADGTYSAINTSYGNDGGADAINFSQGRVWTIDQYGKYIWMTEDRNGNHAWAFSNDSGGSWSQGSETYGFLTRASVAYDSINDVLHVLWTAQSSDSSGGVIYRRYSITRDGSHNITDIKRMDSGTVNLQLDYTDSSRNTEQPVMLWVNDGSTSGSIVAVWEKDGSNLAEVRASMRKLSMTASDGTAGNWQAVDNSGATFTTDPPQVAADKIYATTVNGKHGAPAATVRGGSGSRKNDLYIFVAEDNTSAILSYRAIWDSGNKDWRGGIQSPVTVGSMDETSGYNAKHELITRPVLDTTNDRLYIGWARWKDNTNGDTVSMAYLDSSDTPSSTIDLYSALGTHSYAPTLDIAYDATMGQVYAAYIESTTNGDNGSIDYKTYDGSTLSGSTRYYTSPGGSSGADGSADIPILYENRQNGRLLFAFRINGAIPPTSGDPHIDDWGYITLPTPTPTPTATPVPSSSSSSSVTERIPSAPQCTDTTPTGIPYVSEALATSATSMKVIFSNWVPYYTIEYGQKPDSFEFAVSGVAGGSFTIHALKPHTTYYFRVAEKNGCTIGAWSNVVKGTTSLSFLPVSIISEPTIPSVPNPIPSITKPLLVPTGTPAPQTTAHPTSTPQSTPVQSENILTKILNFFRSLF